MELKLFGLNSCRKFAQLTARYLGVTIANHIENHFEDGESYVRSDTNVRNSDVYILHDFYSDERQRIDEKFANLLFFVGSLKDASARKITVVAPYLGYARQDRKTCSRAPITTKYVAMQLEAAGVNRLLTMDVHSKTALDNAFRVPTDNLEWKKLLVDYLVGGTDTNGFRIKNHIDAPLSEDRERLTVLSPDIGGMERAELLRFNLEDVLGVNIEPAVFNKRRIDGVVTGKRIIGEVKNRRVIIIDDMIASGSTVRLAAETVERDGGEVFAVCATHGLFTGNAAENLAKINRVVVSDTMPPFRLPSSLQSKLHVVETAEMLARAIRITHEGGSISKLLS